MGSGRGKTRRAQVVGGARPTLPSLQKWRTFVDQGRLKNIALGDYYLGAEPATVGAPEFEVIVRELCRDAVSVGAITLPPSMQIEDLAFKIENNPRTNYDNL